MWGERERDGESCLGDCWILEWCYHVNPSQVKLSVLNSKHEPWRVSKFEGMQLRSFVAHGVSACQAKTEAKVPDKRKVRTGSISSRVIWYVALGMLSGAEVNRETLPATQK